MFTLEELRFIIIIEILRNLPNNIKNQKKNYYEFTIVNKKLKEEERKTRKKGFWRFFFIPLFLFWFLMLSKGVCGVAAQITVIFLILEIFLEGF